MLVRFGVRLLLATLVLGSVLLGGVHPVGADPVPGTQTLSCSTGLVGASRAVITGQAEFRIRCYASAGNLTVIDRVVGSTAYLPAAMLWVKPADGATASGGCAGQTVTLVKNGKLTGTSLTFAATGNFGDNYFELSLKCNTTANSTWHIWGLLNWPITADNTSTAVEWNGTTCLSMKPGYNSTVTTHDQRGCATVEASGTVYNPFNLFDYGSTPTGPGEPDEPVDVDDGAGCDANIGLLPTSWVPGLAKLIRCGMFTLFIPDAEFLDDFNSRLAAIREQPPVQWADQAIASLASSSILFGAWSEYGPDCVPIGETEVCLRDDVGGEGNFWFGGQESYDNAFTTPSLIFIAGLWLALAIAIIRWF